LARLRVLFLATRDYRNPAAAGGDINMWECARYLAFRGHTVTFVASSFRQSPDEETIDRIHVVRVGPLLSVALRTFVYYMLRCRGRYDVVVAEGFGGSRIPRLTPLYVKAPIVSEWRQLHRELFAAQYPSVLLPLLNLSERATAFVHRKTFVLAYTPEWKEAFARFGFRRENIVVVPVSIREEWVDRERNAPVAEATIAWIGKFRRYKCPDHIIRAMPAIIRERPDARLILAGRHDDRRYEDELAALVGRLGLASNIEFRFDLAEREKHRLLSGCRLFVLPSSVEGFGIVVLEANACGVPVVASTGVPESVVSEGRNGLRYPFGSLEDLAASSLRVLNDDALYLRLSVGGTQFVREFTWKRVGAAYESALERLAKIPTSRSASAESGASDERVRAAAPDGRHP
jgi:glycosyltransferase involved in cell wall biosynthesis